MIIKAVTLFLIAMLALGMFGKLHLVGIGKKRKKLARTKCKKCGTPLIGKTPCVCQKKSGS